MKRFENANFKQREEINDKMAEMFGLLRELMTSRAPKKVLVREEARHLITKHVNSISLIRIEEEKSVGISGVVGKNIVESNKSIMAETLEEVDRDDEVTNRTNNELVRSVEKDLTGEKLKELVKTPSSCRTYAQGKALENDYQKGGYGGNFVIPCTVGGLKYMDALVDQGSDVNIMPLSTYNRLTNKKLIKTDIRLSLASQSHIQPLGIAEEVLVEIAGFIYPADFVILYIKEDRRKPFILGTPFLTTTKAEIRLQGEKRRRSHVKECDSESS
ncbi:MAK10-like protein [Tanacetum coccineum]